jgi:hypothetical protein
MGCQRLLYNGKNHVRTASLFASSVKPASSVFPRAATRAGNGNVRLNGEYTGTADAVFDLEILSGGAGRHSEPVFSGIGSGMLQNIAVGELPAQDIRVTLADMGTPSATATFEVSGFTLRAKPAAVAGNAVTITVDESALVTAVTNYATFDGLRAGTEIVTGQEWDFGAKSLNADNAMAADAVRLQFGTDPQIYRQYRVYAADGWEYHFVPKIAREIPAGTAVKQVTGHRHVTVTNGVITETLGDIVTVYDFLASLSDSELIDVGAGIVNDMTPGGCGTLDLMLKTSAYALPVKTSGNSVMTGLDSIVIPAAAPTEQLTIRCVNADVNAAEIWSVAGTASGSLGEAVTGDTFSAGGYQFVIPKKYPVMSYAASSDTSAARIVSKSFVARSGAEKMPQLGLRMPAIGKNGFSGRLALTWTKNYTDTNCDWQDAAVTGVLSNRLLGYDNGGAIMPIDAEYKSRLLAVYDWRKDFIAANVKKSTDAIVGWSAWPTLQMNNYTYYYGLRGKVTPVVAGTTITLPVQYYFQKRTDADSWLAEYGRCGWNTTGLAITYSPTTGLYCLAGNVVSGGTVNVPTYFSTDYFTLAPQTPTYDNHTITMFPQLSELSNEVLMESLRTTLQGLGSNITWGLTAADNNLNTAVPMPVKPTSTAQNVYAAAHNDIMWADKYISILLDSLGKIYTVEDALTMWDALQATMLAELTDLAAKLSDDLTAVPDDLYLEKYRAEIDLIYLEAGIVPGKSSGSSSAGGWSRQNSDYWQAEGYAPIYNNVLYYSTKLDADENPVSTFEFAFAVAIKCASSLKYGDQIVIEFGSGSVSTTSKTYQVNDTFTLPVIAGQNKHFTGGVAGDDTRTWEVTGSVSGAFADYSVVDGVNYHFSNNGLEFDLVPGGISFALGDSFAFTIEGGHFRWRKDGGSWSESTGIADTVLLTTGLSAAFDRGAAPSFLPGDSYSFDALQPYSPDNVKNPFPEGWQWNGATAELALDFGAPRNIDAIVLARHTLPSTAGIAAYNSDDGITWSLMTTLPWQSGPIAWVPATTNVARRIKISVTGAAGASIGYLFIGEAVITKYSPTMSLRKVYDLTHGAKPDFGSIYIGEGMAGKLEWNNNISATELADHVGMIDWCKRGGDEPVVFLPHYKNPAEAYLCTVETDALDIVDELDFQPDETSRRIMSLSLPLGALT